jgi:amidase
VRRSANYTLVWNGLDYSALVIPVTRVDQQLDVKKDPHKFFSREDEINYELCTLSVILGIHAQVPNDDIPR